MTTNLWALCGPPGDGPEYRYAARRPLLARLLAALRSRWARGGRSC